MSRFTRILASLAPASVPPHLQARCLAAMEGRTMSPAPGVCGEAAPGAGQHSAAAELDSTPPAAADPAPEGESQVPASDPDATSSSTQLTPSGPPPCETDLFWEPSPDAAFDLSTGRLAHLLDRWKGTPA